MLCFHDGGGVVKGQVLISHVVQILEFLLVLEGFTGGCSHGAKSHCAEEIAEIRNVHGLVDLSSRVSPDDGLGIAVGIHFGGYCDDVIAFKFAVLAVASYKGFANFQSVREGYIPKVNGDGGSAQQVINAGNNRILCAVVDNGDGARDQMRAVNVAVIIDFDMPVGAFGLVIPFQQPDLRDLFLADGIAVVGCYPLVDEPFVGAGE